MYNTSDYSKISSAFMVLTEQPETMVLPEQPETVVALGPEELVQELAKMIKEGTVPEGVLDMIMKLGEEARTRISNIVTERYRTERQAEKNKILHRIQTSTIFNASSKNHAALAESEIAVTVGKPDQAIARLKEIDDESNDYSITIFFGGLGERTGKTGDDYREYEEKKQAHTSSFDISYNSTTNEGSCHTPAPFTWEEMPQNLKDAIQGQIAAANK